MDATVLDAVKVMAEQAVGSVVVLDGERVAGVFSERDYVRMTLTGAGPVDQTPMRQVMSDGVNFATPMQTAHACLALMNEKRLDCIPVLEDGKLLGLLSIDDVQKAIIAQYEGIFQAIELDQKILFLQGTYSC